MARPPSACTLKPLTSQACGLRQGAAAVGNAQSRNRTGHQPFCMLCIHCPQCLGAKGAVQCELCVRCELCSVNHGKQ